MATIKRPQQEPDINEFYIPVRGGINAYTKSLNETTYTPIGDFYKATKVGNALKQVDVGAYMRYTKVPSTVEVKVTKDDKGNKLITHEIKTVTTDSPDDFIDNEAIRKKLLSHIKDVKAYYEGLMASSVFLTKTAFYLVPPDNSPEFEAMAKCFKSEIVPDKFGQGKIKVKKIDPKAKDKLLDLIKKQPRRVGYTLNVLQEANTDTNADLSLTPREKTQAGYFTRNTPIGIAERYALLLDLAEKCKIKPEGFTRQAVDKDGVERPLADTHAIMESLLTDALGIMSEDFASKELGKRSVVNVRNPDDHAIMGNPTAINFMELLVKNAQEQVDTLLKQYKTLEELQEENGIEMYLDDKRTLPIFDLKDPKKRAKAIMNFVALQTRSLVAFDEWKKDHPDEKVVPISELAKYTSYRKEVTSGKGLKPEHRNNLVKGLEIAGHLSHKYITGKSRVKEQGKWKEVIDRKYIYLLTRLKSDKIDPKTGRIISVEIDYDPEYKRALNLNLGVVLDNLDKVKKESAIVIGLYLCQRMVAHQTAVVEHNKPIRTTVKKLVQVACIFDTNPTQRCSTVKEALNDLEQANVIGKWATAKGDKNITEKDPDTLSLDIWAKDPSVYITPNQHKALKASKEVYQKEWHTALKRLHDPNKAYTNPLTLAKDLGITKEQLDFYLGNGEIPDEVGERIIALKEELAL